MPNNIPTQTHQLVSLFGKRTANAIQNYRKHNKVPINNQNQLNKLIFFLQTKYSTPEEVIDDIIMYFKNKTTKKYNLDFTINTNSSSNRNQIPPNRNQIPPIRNQIPPIRNRIPSNLFRAVIQDFRESS